MPKKIKISQIKKIPRGIKEFVVNSINPKITEVLLSKERTLLAKKRTTINQMNTCIALAALGFALLKAFENSGLYLPMAIIGVILLIISAAFAVYSIKGFKKYSKKLKRIKKGRGSLDKLYFSELNQFLEGKGTTKKRVASKAWILEDK